MPDPAPFVTREAFKAYTQLASSSSSSAAMASV